MSFQNRAPFASVWHCSGSVPVADSVRVGARRSRRPQRSGNPSQPARHRRRLALLHTFYWFDPRYSHGLERDHFQLADLSGPAPDAWRPGGNPGISSRGAPTPSAIQPHVLIPERVRCSWPGIRRTDRPHVSGWRPARKDIREHRVVLLRTATPVIKPWQMVILSVTR